MRATQLLAAAALSLSCNTQGRDGSSGAAAGLQRFVLAGCGISVLLPAPPEVEVSLRSPPKPSRYLEYVAQADERTFRITCRVGEQHNVSTAQLLESVHSYEVTQLRASAPEIVERVRADDRIETVIRGKFATIVRRTQVLPNGDLFGLITVSPKERPNESAVAAFLDGLQVEHELDAGLPPIVWPGAKKAGRSAARSNPAPAPTPASGAAPDAGAPKSDRAPLYRFPLLFCGNVSVRLPRRPATALERPFPGVSGLIYQAEFGAKKFSILCKESGASDLPKGDVLEQAHRILLSTGPSGKRTELSRGSGYIESSMGTQQGTFLLRTERLREDGIVAFLVGPVASRDEYLVKEFLDGPHDWL